MFGADPGDDGRDQELRCERRRFVDPRDPAALVEVVFTLWVLAQGISLRLVKVVSVLTVLLLAGLH